MSRFFLFFFVSGFCSILYEMIWLRLSMAQFGVTSAMVSIVISMFMAGIGLGSWGSSFLIRKYEDRIRVHALRLYALTELLIGIASLTVSYQLLWGRHLLEQMALSSYGYYFTSAVWVALTLVPWCACMGATFPLAMLAIKYRFRHPSSRSFSYLYLANLLGALSGALIPLFLIELYGFRHTLYIGAALNGLLALFAFFSSFQRPVIVAKAAVLLSPSATRKQLGRQCLALLFAAGFTSMGMEVVWIRQFTPYLGTVVYSFAAVLSVYLASSFVGSQIYRYMNSQFNQMQCLSWIVLGLAALLPLVTANSQLPLANIERLIFGIAPFSMMLGFITPMLIDYWSLGDPDKAGYAYAMNVIGCILGPLVAGFLLLPLLSERWVLFLFALPWFVVSFFSVSRTNSARWQQKIAYAAVLGALLFTLTSKGYESQFVRYEIRRDNTATVIAMGHGMQKRLLINGVGITALTPITKMMAHLPLAFLNHAPQNALVVCFGMGTTYRSLLSWDIATTAVELVPSVPKMFAYYHADSKALLQSPLSHIVIDDGRRYLERTSQQYDVITVDPPPPVEAAGSSLLYSKEFYAIIKKRLKPDGILQQWLPSGDVVDQVAVLRALVESFPYVRVFHSMENWGFHFLASNQPILYRSAQELARQMPVKAAQDLIEWNAPSSAEHLFEIVLANELPLAQMLAKAAHVPALQDDKPVNEYYLLRYLGVY